MVDNADCLDFLAALAPDSVDCVFGSPPYSGKGARYGNSNNLKGKQWASWMLEVIRQSVRVCTGVVGFVIDSGTEDFKWDAAPAHLLSMIDDAGLHQLHPNIFFRSGISGSGGSSNLRNDAEFILLVHRPGQPPYADPLACAGPPKYGPGGAMSHRTKDGSRVPKKAYNPPALANPGTVRTALYTADQVLAILFPFDGAGTVRHLTVGGGHMGNREAHKSAAPFPIPLPEFYIRTFCPSQGLVIDPFAGSGSTGEAALRCGRRFRGCDNDADQVAVANARLSRVQSSDGQAGGGRVLLPGV
jgi:hypothetical protein